MDFNQLLQTIAPVSQVSADYEKLKRDAQEMKEYTQAYIAAQFALQLISTAAMVGLFLLTLKQSGRKH